MLFVLERCVPQAERDVPFGRDVCFASDVRFAREDAEHITSLCDGVAIHHYGEAITSLRLAATSLPKLHPDFPQKPCNPHDFMLYYSRKAVALDGKKANPDK